jgi:hypothetical protein
MSVNDDVSIRSSGDMTGLACSQNLGRLQRSDGEARFIIIAEESQLRAAPIRVYDYDISQA